MSNYNEQIELHCQCTVFLTLTRPTMQSHKHLGTLASDKHRHQQSFQFLPSFPHNVYMALATSAKASCEL